MADKYAPIRLSGEGLVSEGEVFAWVHEPNPDAYSVAEYIVRAVNSHALMLEALRQAREWLTFGQYTIYDIAKIEAAIAAASGEK